MKPALRWSLKYDFAGRRFARGMIFRRGDAASGGLRFIAGMIGSAVPLRFSRALKVRMRPHIYPASGADGTDGWRVATPIAILESLHGAGSNFPVALNAWQGRRTVVTARLAWLVALR
ncbi:MAG: hypothetical protein ABWY18_00625 [Tardiphaga sp.]